MKNLYEVFEEFEKAPKREEKIDILRNNKSYALECVLRGAFHPNVRYVIDEIPTYRKSDSPAGLGYTSIHQELGRVYLFYMLLILMRYNIVYGHLLVIHLMLHVMMVHLLVFLCFYQS